MENVKRVTLTGNWQAVTFSRATKSYFVKNFSEGDIYVSFEEDDDVDTSIKILKKHWRTNRYFSNNSTTAQL